MSALGPVYLETSQLDQDMETRVDGLLEDLCGATEVPRAAALPSLRRVAREAK
jgi:hypothetical protein